MKKILKILVVGLLIRLLLLFVDYSFDVNSFISWGRFAYTHGFSGLYEQDRGNFILFSPNYPPVTIMAFTLLYGLYNTLFQISSFLHFQLHIFPGKLLLFLESPLAIAGFIKLLPVLADLGIAALVYKLSRSKIAASLVLFNPAFIFMSALWGQIEPVGAFFILAALYVLLTTQKKIVPWILCTLGILTKQTTVIFLPVFLVAYYKRHGLFATIKGLMIGVLLFWVSFLPFYKTGNILIYPFITYSQKILSVSGLPFVSNYAFNFWGFVTQGQHIVASNPFLFGISYTLCGYGITALLLLGLLVVLRKKVSNEVMYLTFALSAFIAFLFLTKIHERHFAQVLPFLILLAGKDRRIFYIVLILSVVHLLNMYHSWAVPLIPTLLSFINLPLISNICIVLTLCIFSILYWWQLKQKVHQ